MTTTDPPPAATRWRVEVSPACIGSGMCVATAAEHFELAGGRARPRRELVAPDDVVRAAVELCPMGAITARRVP